MLPPNDTSSSSFQVDQEPSQSATKIKSITRRPLVIGLGAATVLLLVALIGLYIIIAPQSDKPDPLNNAQSDRSFSLGSTPQPSTSVTPSPTAPTSSPTPPASTTTPSPTITVPSGWKTYTNSSFGFSFKYPPNWQVWDDQSWNGDSPIIQLAYPMEPGGYMETVEFSQDFQASCDESGTSFTVVIGTQTVRVAVDCSVIHTKTSTTAMAIELTNAIEDGGLRGDLEDNLIIVLQSIQGMTVAQ